MFPLIIGTEVLTKIDNWPHLKRWERRELGQELRLLGLAYREIALLIPVAKGTLSNWCRDIELTEEQAGRLEEVRVFQFKRNRVGRELRKRALERAAAL